MHIPHGMSYSVAGPVKDFRPEGYPQEEPMVPHGMSVIVNAPREAGARELEGLYLGAMKYW